MRTRAWCAIAIAVGVAACNAPDPPARPAPAPPADEGEAPGSADDAVKALGDPDPAVRERAARWIREAIANDPRAFGDPGEEFWKKRLAGFEPGVTTEEILKATGGQKEHWISTGPTTTAINLRLDDHWVVMTYVDNPDKLREFGPLSRRARSVWVEPPKSFTGEWVTYFVNGVVAYEIEYAGGVYRRFRSYFDSGRLGYEQVYVDGRIDGPEVGWHPDGSKAYEGRHAAGRMVGKWTHWYPSGKLQSERSYVAGAFDGPSISYREDGTKSSRIDYTAGKETGQAAWDEQGKLLYARGTAADAK